jgi:hypothetical protein
MAFWGSPRRTVIDLDVVEQAFEAEGTDRREGEDRRASVKPREPEGPKVMLWALGLVGAAAIALAAAQFTDLKTEFRQHKVVEEQKHEQLRQTVEAIHTQLELKAANDKGNGRLLRAMARKLGITVTEAEAEP